MDPDRNRATAELETRGYLVITSTLSLLEEFALRSTADGKEQLFLLGDEGRGLDSPSSGLLPRSEPSFPEPVFGSEIADGDAGSDDDASDDHGDLDCDAG